MFAEDEAALLRGAARDEEHLTTLLERRLAGEPLETLVGWVELDGARLQVAAGVFVPRQRTRLLVRLAVALARPDGVHVELCCGVAPVAAAVHVGEVHAADIDPVPLACARANVPHGQVHQGDLFAALPARLRGRVTVLAANAPYVPSAEVATMPPEARDHEPRQALDGGEDGVAVHRRIAAQAPAWLAPGGVLLVETGRRQASLTAAAMRTAGLATTVETDDEVAGTVVAGRAVTPGGTG